MRYKVVKMRVEPNSSQRRIIDHTIDYNRYIFNFLITANKLTYAKESRLLSEFEMNNLCTILRRRWSCFRIMHSMTHNDVSRRVHQACGKCMDNAVSKKRRAVAKGVMSAEDPLPMTWPRYRNNNRYDSYAHLSNRDFGIVESTNENGKMVRRLKLGKVKGTVRCYNQGTPITGIPKACIVTRKDMGAHTEYYACISYEIAESEQRHPDNPKAVGIDLGIRHIAATSEGKLYDHQNDMRKDLKKLKKLSNRLSKDSHDHSKRRRSLSRLKHHYKRMVNKRKENIEHISKDIVEDHDIVVMERLKVKKLWEKSLGRSMTRGFVNSSLGMLRRRISDKAGCAGAKVIEVDPRGTSQTCSQCGEHVGKTLNTSIHRCPVCGYTADRDINAAINILLKGLTGNPVPARDESPAA